ncbi:mucin-5AC-like [Iris pallida]|uniref:Mucin-5AC-like n=1 Tax=Iris pallida TaxID=29817 RepID=A0AAX6EQK4_IRIPA|nr:mucin-5AC-like [Iris pallida]
MSRFSTGPTACGGRRVSTGSPHQFRPERVGGGGNGRDGEDALDLFSRTRASTGSDGHGEAIRLERISVGAARIGRGGMEDMLDAQIGKHDYDWLLTPPETPLFPSSLAKEITKESPVASTPRGRSTARSISNTRPSRLSTSQTENGHSNRPVRSSSVTRPSISNNYSTSSFSNNNRTSILNTSSSSVTSSRPSTPGSRSTSGRPSNTSTTARPSMSTTTTRPSMTSTTARPSMSTATARPSMTSTTARPSITSTVARSSTASRPVASRLPTPTKTRPTSTISGERITRPSHNSRPSTPTSRPQTPSNPKPNVNTRPNSRPSTPTRRPTTSSSSAAPGAGGRYPSVGRIPAANSRNQAAPISRPSSPGPRPRAPVRPIDLPDFPNDVPPNLRTKLPERPASAGRTRPGMALIARASLNSEAGVPAAAAAPVTSKQRNYLPVVSRSRFPENPPKAATKLHSNNGHEATPEIQRPAASDGIRRPTKPTSATESTGFGRTISKKSLDMALRHMDIRQGMGGIRASSLFPQSIRSTTARGHPARKSDPVVPLTSDEYSLENGSCSGTFSPAYSLGDFSVTRSPDRDSIATRESDMDVHRSSRCDALLLKEEDSKNTSWLHNVEDKSGQSPVFDHRFEPLPEPSGLL